MATKTTAYQRLQKKKKSFCAGRSTKAAVKKVAAAYVSNAVRKAEKAAPKGKKKAAGKAAKMDATTKANRVLRGGCSVSSSIAGKKKKSTATKR